jgi:hypothetical protein
VDQTAPVAARLELGVDGSVIRLVRLVVSGVASTMSMRLEDVEACRAAADELCQTLVDVAAVGGSLSVQIAEEDCVLVVSGQVERDPQREVEVDRAELARLIVEASVDSYEIVIDPPIASFRFTKRVGPP